MLHCVFQEFILIVAIPEMTLTGNENTAMSANY